MSESVFPRWASRPTACPPKLSPGSCRRTSRAWPTSSPSRESGRSDLVDLRAGALDHLGPLRRVAPDQGAEFLGRAAAALAAEREEELLGFRLQDRAIDRGVQPVEHRARHAGGGDCAAPS